MTEQSVLIIDDSADVTEGLAMALEREGRRIITCNDSESASVVIDHIDISFIVSDINFSGPFGYEGLDILLRARRRVPPVPIVLITGAVSDQLRAEAMRMGAVEILEKPFDLDTLERVLGSSGGGRP